MKFKIIIISIVRNWLEKPKYKHKLKHEHDHKDFFFITSGEIWHTKQYDKDNDMNIISIDCREL